MLIVKTNEDAVCGKCGRLCPLGAHKLHVECAGLNIARGVCGIEYFHVYLDLQNARVIQSNTSY